MWTKARYLRTVESKPTKEMFNSLTNNPVHKDQGKSGYIENLKPINTESIKSNNKGSGSGQPKQVVLQRVKSGSSQGVTSMNLTMLADHPGIGMSLRV